MANIVGDKSTGKTLLAIEACANFRLQYPNGRIFYDETEAAFDIEYAQSVGLPSDAINFPKEKHDTVQQCARSLEAFSASLKTNQPGLYVIDSLDAVDEESELRRREKAQRAIEKGEEAKGSYGTGKAREMSALFRRIVRDLEKKRVTLLIISQVRDNIGVMFGAKHIRSGGHALDFYATHVLWLSQIKRIQATRQGVSRKIGIQVRAMVNKNKVGPPFRDCDFPILFNFGIDDVSAMIDWLMMVGHGKSIKCANAKEADKLVSRIIRLEGEQYQKIHDALAQKTRNAWQEIESRFKPPRSKYG